MYVLVTIHNQIIVWYMHCKYVQVQLTCKKMTIYDIDIVINPKNLTLQEGFTII